MSDNQSVKKPHTVGPVLVLLGLAGAGWYWWKPVPASVEAPVAVAEPAVPVRRNKNAGTG